MCRLRNINNQVNFLIGRNAFALVESTLEAQTIWTSFHNFAPADVFSSSDWYDADPRTNKPVNLTRFPLKKHAETSNTPVLVAQVLRRKLIASTQFRNPGVRVVCEYYLEPQKNIHVIKFQDCREEQWVLRSEDTSINPACYSEATTATLLLCIHGCAGNVHCRSVYYNPTSGKCVFILYVHAYLPAQYKKPGRRWTCCRKT
ncbi:PAN domain protein, partial [Opisthorchis viverrini]